MLYSVPPIGGCDIGWPLRIKSISFALHSVSQHVFLLVHIYIV